MYDKYFRNPQRFSTPPRTKESKLLLCKCSHTGKDYFTRLDRKIGERSWIKAYAFPFHESMRGDSCIVSKHETIRIDKTAEDWNGCPYCGRENNVFCECGAILCHSMANDGDFFTCIVCHSSARLAFSDTFDTQTSSH